MENERTREDDYKDFAELLNRHGADYLIVGSYAVIFHTNVPRDTKDIDFWIRPTPENAQKCAAAILDFCGLAIRPEELLEDKIFFIGEAPHRLDIFNAQGGLNFSEAWKKREEGKFREVPVHYISHQDLVRLKWRFDRPHDRKDLSRLNRKKKKK